jgi:uncharacterized protein (DUF885 family)
MRELTLLEIRMRDGCLRSASILIFSLLAACSREKAAAPPEQAAAPPAQTVTPAATTWSEFTAKFIESRFAADPSFGVQSGRHEFDGRMPDLSRAALQAEAANLKAQLAELDKFDGAALKPAERYEREYLRWVIETALFWHDSAEAPYRNPAWYIDKLDPSMYLTREYAPLPKRLEGFLGYSRAIPGIAAAIRANLKTPLPKAYVERGVQAFGGYASFYRKDMPPIFAQAGDAKLETDLVAANDAAAKAMEDLTAWLESQRRTATDDFALGAAKFSEMLKVTERVDMPLEELEQVGRKDLERNLAALKEACEAYAPKQPIPACIDRMRADKPTGGTVDGAKAQLDELRKFVADHKIVSIPNQEQALVAESPPYNRGNFAYISIPGPFENPNVKSTYYVAPPDAKWSAAERNAYLPGKAYLLFVSTHEVWPGHYLQSQFANANPSHIEAMYWDYAFGEGWAHYTEEMMYDAGLGAGKPEMRVGMVTNALLRDVRFLSAICLHSGCMKLDESEKMFREQAFADAGNARQQALRGTYDPGYLAYTLGKLMIRKLGTDWLAKNADATPQQFHDKLLSYGTPPVPMVRREMLGVSDSPL